MAWGQLRHRRLSQFAIGGQFATTTEIGATSREIAATSRDLVRTMTEVTSAADQASILAGSGQQGLARMEETMHLNRLFNGTPAKLAAKLAGLPKPTNCL